MIGSFFLTESTINSRVFLDMLKNYTIPQRADDRDIIFQLGGEPPHFGIIVVQSLDKNFSEMWLGRGAPIPWPPYSPDLMLQII